jgi:hypothetical protein
MLNAASLWNDRPSENEAVTSGNPAGTALPGMPSLSPPCLGLSIVGMGCIILGLEAAT